MQSVYWHLAIKWYCIVFNNANEQSCWCLASFFVCCLRSIHTWPSYIILFIVQNKTNWKILPGSISDDSPKSSSIDVIILRNLTASSATICWSNLLTAFPWTAKSSSGNTTYKRWKAEWKVQTGIYILYKCHCSLILAVGVCLWMVNTFVCASVSVGMARRQTHSHKI